MTKPTAPSFSAIDIVFETCVCRAGVASGSMNCTYTLRANRFPDAIAIIAAGTSAPIAIDASPNAATGPGSICSSRAGTATFAPYWGSGWTPAAIAM